MQLVCPCLNLTINVVVEDQDRILDDALVKPETIQQLCDDDAVEDDFFALCIRGSVARFMLDSEKGIVEKLPALLKRRHVDRWEIRKCILCNADAFAIGSNFPGQVLVNTKLLLRDESVIAERRKSTEISPTFQVILPKMKDDFAVSNFADAKHTAGNRSGLTSGATSVISRGALHAVQACVGQHLRKEQEAMEERIRVYTEEQQAAFDRLKAEAKLEKMKVLALLAKNSGGVGTGIVSLDSYWSSGSNSLGGTVFGDEEFDSAVPLSPLSLTSGGDPSPGLDTSRVIGGSFRVPSDDASAPLRPKAHSNPASLSGWKRKRHSGGPGLAPSLTSHPEEQQDIFSFEEQENDEMRQTSYLPADDEGDTTDDSGTGEDYRKYYPPPPPSTNSSAATLIGQSRPISSSGHQQTLNYCTSLPVRVPGVPNRHWSLKAMDYIAHDNGSNFDDEEEENDQVDEIQPKDVGASMQALARSIQSADDPERLFGERPQRRRWKTGENVQQPPQLQLSPQDVFPSEPSRGKATVVVLFKEEQNF